MIFRRATEADIPAILPLMTRFNEEELITFTPDKGKTSLEALFHNHGWGFVMVADDEGELCAYALVAFSFDIEFGGRDAFLCELFVREDHRGSGLGRSMIEIAEQSARDEDVSALHLMVRRANERARGLYEKVGFVEDPRPLMTKPLT